MILDDLAAYARLRVEQAQRIKPLAQVQAEARSMAHGERMGTIEATAPRFADVLAADRLSFICEIKRASPSKGLIDPEFPYLDIAREYEQAGADCISCLTEPKWFLGSDKIFTEVRAVQKRPMIRKDFTVDPYQVYEAKLLGAQAVLLICSLLDTRELESYLALCDELGLDALVEAHDAQEIASAVAAGARIIGVNNRNLKDFTVDFGNAQRLRELIPPGVLYVAESGVKTAEDVAQVAALGADALLVGEALMRSPDKSALLAEFRRAAQTGSAQAGALLEGQQSKGKFDGASVEGQSTGIQASGGHTVQQTTSNSTFAAPVAASVGEAQPIGAAAQAPEASQLAQSRAKGAAHMGAEDAVALKFCGVSHPDDARAVNLIKPDYVGLVLWPSSKRAVSASEARTLSKILDPTITRVGVFVNEEVEQVARYAEEGIIEVAQLHGVESEEYIKRLRARVPALEIWQAFIIKTASDVERAQHSTADKVLVDGGKGEGEAFEWQLLRNLKRPFVLAGGLTCENVAKAIEVTSPAIVDVSSGIERDTRAPDGRTRKDQSKMEAFAYAVRRARQG